MDLILISNKDHLDHLDKRKFPRLEWVSQSGPVKKRDRNRFSVKWVSATFPHPLWSAISSRRSR